MGEYVAPYTTITDGFTDLSSLFKKIMKDTSPSTNEGFADISPILGDVLKLTGSSGTPTGALKVIIQQEKETADSLIDTAKRINPVAQAIIPKATAYDAAFESDKSPGLPRAGATLQGFAILLLIISYIALTMVSVIAVNNLTQNAYSAGKTFVAFIILGVIIFSLITRFG